MYRIYFSTEVSTGKIWNPALNFDLNSQVEAISIANSLKNGCKKVKRQFAVCRCEESEWLYKTEE